MNRSQLAGNWKEIKGKLRMEYADLTDDDLAYSEGEEEALLGRLQKSLGKTLEQVEQLLSRF